MTALPSMGADSTRVSSTPDGGASAGQRRRCPVMAKMPAPMKSPPPPGPSARPAGPSARLSRSLGGVEFRHQLVPGSSCGEKRQSVGAPYQGLPARGATENGGRRQPAFASLAGAGRHGVELCACPGGALTVDAGNARLGFRLFARFGCNRGGLRAVKRQPPVMVHRPRGAPPALRRVRLAIPPGTLSRLGRFGLGPRARRVSRPQLAGLTSSATSGAGSKRHKRRKLGAVVLLDGG